VLLGAQSNAPQSISNPGYEAPHSVVVIGRERTSRSDAEGSGTIQVIVSALAEEDYELAQTIPTKDLKRILPSFNNLRKVCVACHLEYTVNDRS